MGEDDLEALGQIADDLDSALYTARLPGIPAATHIAGLTGIVTTARDRLMAFCRERGLDCWSDQP